MNILCEQMMFAKLETYLNNYQAEFISFRQGSIELQQQILDYKVQKYNNLPLEKQSSKIASLHELLSSNPDGSCLGISAKWLINQENGKKFANETIHRASSLFFGGKKFQQKSRRTMFKPFEDHAHLALHEVIFARNQKISFEIHDFKPYSENIDIDAFIKFLTRSQGSVLLNITGAVKDLKEHEKFWVHACACYFQQGYYALFEPNYGEVVFKDPQIFIKWLREEINEGELHYMKKQSLWDNQPYQCRSLTIFRFISKREIHSLLTTREAFTKQINICLQHLFINLNPEPGNRKFPVDSLRRAVKKLKAPLDEIIALGHIPIDYLEHSPKPADLFVVGQIIIKKLEEFHNEIEDRYRQKIIMNCSHLILQLMQKKTIATNVFDFLYTLLKINCSHRPVLFDQIHHHYEQLNSHKDRYTILTEFLIKVAQNNAIDTDLVDALLESINLSYVFLDENTLGGHPFYKERSRLNSYKTIFYDEYCKQSGQIDLLNNRLI